MKRPAAEMAETQAPALREAVFENEAVELRVALAGGSLISFRFRNEALNPLSWDSAVHDGRDVCSPRPRPRGHFLCLDRWGPPTEAEERHGMGYHGEASAVQWSDSLEAALPLAGLRISRRVRLTGSVAVVRERVTNENALGRLYNAVQHPSLSAPFLDAGTAVDCNARQGFAQGPNRTDSPAPQTPTFLFPRAINRAGAEADARFMTGGDDDVQSYEVDSSSEHGWVCAVNAKLQLLIGYVWPRKDYPWISLWCCSRNGVPCARGIEFGTTGLHQPFPILVRHPEIFGLPTYQHIDARESHNRSYAAFLMKAPTDFQGVETVAVGAESIIVVERGGRRFDVATGSEPLFA